MSIQLHLIQIDISVADHGSEGGYSADARSRSGQGQGQSKEGSIKVVQRDRLGDILEVKYGELEQMDKESVLTDLLVKSAVSYAVSKQQV